jgi:hypothetical protein
MRRKKALRKMEGVLLSGFPVIDDLKKELGK